LVDNTGGTFDTHPSISKSDGASPFTTQEWNIVWQRTFSPTDEDIRGAQIHWDGSVTTPSFSVDCSELNDELPTASSLLDVTSLGGPRPYLVAYQRGPAVGSHDIQATVLIGSGFVTSANLSALEGVALGQDQVQPSADASAQIFSVAYSEQFSSSTTDYDIDMVSLCLFGSNLVLVDRHEDLANSFDRESAPQISSAHSGGAINQRFMAVWKDTFDSPFGDIEGAIYDASDGNDDCFSATEVIDGDQIAGDLSIASNDGATTCGASSTNPDVWYRFTAPCDGKLFANTCGTNDAGGVDTGMDTALSIHLLGCPGSAGNTLTCDDDAGPPNCGGLDAPSFFDSSVVLCMTAGQLVRIRASHFGASIADGRFILNTEFRCRGDIDGNDAVDIDDLIEVILQWECISIPGGCSADVNCDGIVDVDDLIIVILAFGFQNS
jgi:hypothetical protein